MKFGKGDLTLCEINAVRENTLCEIMLFAKITLCGTTEMKKLCADDF